MQLEVCCPDPRPDETLGFGPGHGSPRAQIFFQASPFYVTDLCPFKESHWHTFPCEQVWVRFGFQILQYQPGLAGPSRAGSQVSKCLNFMPLLAMHLTAHGQRLPYVI